MFRPAASLTVLALSVVVLVSVFAPILAAPATANVTGEPEISLTVADNRVTAGETTSLEVSVVNRGEVDSGSSEGNINAERRVTAARGLTLRPRDDSPITVHTRERAVGNVPDGEAVPTRFEITVDEDADPGTYTIPVEVRYKYTPFISERQSRTQTDRVRSETRYIKVVVDEDARFEVIDVDAPAPGDSGTLDVEVVNAGSATANDAVIGVTSLAGDLAVGNDASGETYVEEWKPGETRELTFRASVDADAADSELPATLSAEYTADDVAFESQSRFGVEPSALGTLRVTDIESTAGPGSDGVMLVTLKHTGDRPLADTTVEFASRSSGLRFGADGRTTTAYVGNVAPDTQRTVRVEASFAEEARSRDYAVDLTMNYDERGGTGGTEHQVIGVEPDDAQTFAFENVESTLRVAQDGTVRGTVVNEGPNEVRNVVVTLSPPGENVQVLEPEVALGTLEPGERVAVAFDVEVSSAARAGPRQFTLETDYENLEGDARSADDIRFRETIQPRRDVFTVEPVNATITAGESDRVVLKVTNNKDETVTDVSAKVFASQPLSVSDDEAFVDELEPGETARLPFRVSAADSAMEKAYPISVDFQYVDESGETRLTDSYRVPVSVEEESGGLFGSVGPAIPAALAALGLAPLAPIAFRFRRR